MCCSTQCSVLLTQQPRRKIGECKLVAFPFSLTGQVDAVIGAFRNFELNQIHLEKQEGVAFFPEQYGVPVYDELILVANRNNLASKKFLLFNRT